MNDDIRNFIKQLSRGGVKSIPIAGAFLEQVIYGTLDEKAAQEQSEKLHSALAQIKNELQGRDVSFAGILDDLDAQAAFRDEIKAQLAQIKDILKDPDRATIPTAVRNAADKVPRVFISHSSQDKPFARKLTTDLERQNLYVWLDKRELRVGDSIVEKISEGLKETDYFIVILSKASVDSRWVKTELNAAMVEEICNKGTVVLPVLIEDCEIPPLLKDRLYADFRSDYNSALKVLIEVLSQETPVFSAMLPEKEYRSITVKYPEKVERGADCATILSELKIAELRRRISKRVDRGEVSCIWYDTFEEKMDDDMSHRTKNECVIELIDRAKNRRKMPLLLGNICSVRPDLANPR